MNITIKGFISEGQYGPSIPLPQYPTGYSNDDNFISLSFNTINGTFRDKLIALKKKIIWKFDAISETDLEAMYYDGILQTITDNKNRFFYIETDSKIMKTGLYYLGTPSQFSWLGESGGISWYTGELHWIEVDGQKLNNIV